MEGYARSMTDAATFDYGNTPASAQRPAFGYAPLDPLCSPAVSIVTSFYNTGSIFHETARSIMQQSLQQWEWLIVNDGSDDPEALVLLEAYRQVDPRIHVIDHPANRGLSAAHNTGYRAARLTWLCNLTATICLSRPLSKSGCGS